MIDIIRYELRRSPFFWALGPMVILTLTLLLRESDLWNRVWPEASVQVIAAATQLTGVTVAATAAWSAQRVHRGNTTELLYAAARPRWQIELIHLFGTLLYSATPLAVAALVATFMMTPEVPSGSLWPSYIGLGLLSMVIIASLGHAVGSIIKSRLASPIAAALSFGPLFVLSLFVPHYGEATKEVSPQALVVRAVFAVICLSVAIFISTTARRGATLSLPRIAISVALPVGAFALVMVGPPQQYRPPPSNPSCAQAGQTDVCVWPDNAALLPEAVRATAQVNKALEGIISAPDLVAEQGLAVSHRPNSLQLDVIPGASWESYLSLMSYSITSHQCASNNQETNYLGVMASSKMYVWLRSAVIGGMQDPYWDPSNLTAADRQEVESILGKPRTDQVEWARTQIGLIENCRDQHR
ncbi:DUF7224 domain-containing protein [Herbidospora cretacea]|uniref:DUF7224 domain-containing protein n=1 Tax=Herbidospora cretacea TaxID=28444 RepID=UPI0012DBDB57|nr:hypothetical protein [Herbidospora cretacea]